MYFLLAMKLLNTLYYGKIRNIEWQGVLHPYVAIHYSFYASISCITYKQQRHNTFYVVKLFSIPCLPRSLHSNKASVLNKQLKILLNYFVGPLIFIGLCYSIYQQVVVQKDLKQSWGIILDTFSSTAQWRVYVVGCLMILNWGLEAKKWQLLMRPIQTLTFGRAFRAVFSGQALALGTPNRVGEYVGRVVYMQEGNRLRALSLSAVGSVAQLLVTFFLGLFSLIYVYFLLNLNPSLAHPLSMLWLKVLLAIIFSATIVLFLFYYNLAWITSMLEKIPFVAKYSYFIQKLETLHNKELNIIIVLSLIRYLVYVLQYLLLYQFFGINIIWWQIICLTSVQLLIMTLVPSIALAEVGIRGKVSITLFSLLTSNSLGVVATAASIWLINLIIPALAGSLMILGLRIVRK